MSHFARRFASGNGGRYFIRSIAIAATGSALLYSNCDSNLRASVLAHIPERLRNELYPRNLPLFLDHGVSGIIPLSSHRVSPAPSSDIPKKAPAAVDDGAKRCEFLSRDAIANAAAKVGPAVVNVSVTRGNPGVIPRTSTGAGTIIDKDGTILTCSNIVVDPQGLFMSSEGKVDVTLQDGRTFEGTVVNADLQFRIALVKINSKTPLPVAKLGSSSRLRHGELILAIGCPHYLQNTVTAGIVSCVDRKSSDLGLGGEEREYLQTDCAINDGNSGGPLVNIDGEVVGVSVMKLAHGNGVSFAVPIDSVCKIIEHFKKTGRDVRPWLGLKMIDLNEMIIAKEKEREPLFPNVSKGTLVHMVISGSPGDRAGFHPGDVIIQFDGKPVERMKEVVEIMADRLGTPIEVLVIRAGNSVAKLIVIPEEFNPDS